MRNYFFLFVFSLFCLSAYSQRYDLNKKDTSEVQWIKGRKFYVYKVEKSETIFTITKRFKVTEDELLKNNPDLKDGLKNKMELLIPSSPAKKTEAEKKPEEKKIIKKEINVALMLPVNIWKTFIPDSLKTDTTQHESLDAETVSQLEFYEGVMHAVDSLAAKNLKIHLSVFDTENDSMRVSTLLKDLQMKAMDYIIVNGNQNVLKRINQFSTANHIPLLTFALNSNDVLKNNPYGYALTPGSLTQIYEAGKFCSQKFKNANAVVVKPGTSKENERGLAFINGWNDDSELKCRSLDYSKGEFEFLLASMVKGRNNVLFIPSSNEDFVNSVITKLNDTTDVFQITVIGIPTWQFFESTDPAVMENLHTHLFSASHLDRADAITINFRKFFRNQYMTEPSESAYEGNDAIMLICKSFLSDVKDSGPVADGDGIYSTYRFKTSNGLNENQYIRMIRYDNYQMVEVK